MIDWIIIGVVCGGFFALGVVDAWIDHRERQHAQ